MAVIDTVIGGLIALVSSFSAMFLRKYLDSRSRETMEIYEPLYEEVKPASNGYLVLESESVWSDFEQWKRYRTDNKVARLMDEYHSQLEDFRELIDQSENHVDEWLEMFPDEMTWKEDQTTPVIATHAPDAPLERQNWYGFREFVKRYYRVLLLSGDSEAFHRRLFEVAERRGESEQTRQDISTWCEQNPTWGEHVIDQVESADGFVGRQRVLYRSVVDTAEKLVPLLERKVKPPAIVRIWDSVFRRI